MTIYGLLRNLMNWAAEPIALADNGNGFRDTTLWTRSLAELADLPIDPEQVAAQPDEDPEGYRRCAPAQC